MIDLESARGVVLDCLERAGELEESLTARIGAATQGWRFVGPTVPPMGHPYRADFEAWAESAGCGGGRGRGYPAPRFPDRNGRLVGLWNVADCRPSKGPTGTRWVGEPVTFEDWVSEDPERADRCAEDLRELAEVRRFAAHPPTDVELSEGWAPPACVALEQHEDAILAGEDPETGLPADVVDWLRKLVHPPKAEYATAYCLHQLRGTQAPADPGTPWAVKARKRADRIMETVGHGEPTLFDCPAVGELFDCRPLEVPRTDARPPSADPGDCPACGRETIPGTTCARCEAMGHTALTMEGMDK